MGLFAKTSAMTADRDLVDRLCDVDHGLTDWEVRFCDDVAARVKDDGLALTLRQGAKVSEILKRLGR